MICSLIISSKKTGVVVYICIRIELSTALIGYYVKICITIKLRYEIDDSSKSFITEDVLYKNLRAGS